MERTTAVAWYTELQPNDFILPLPFTERGGMTLVEAERDHILEVIELCENNQTLAAQVLDIDGVTLHKKLEKYGWKKPAPPRSSVGLFRRTWLAMFAPFLAGRKLACQVARFLPPARPIFA